MFYLSLLQLSTNNKTDAAVKSCKRNQNQWHNPHEETILNHACVWIL